MMKILRIVIAAMLVSLPISAQQTPPSPGLDFSYKSLLERNNVAKSELIWSWLDRYKSPAEKWFSDWQGKPLVSSILIEYPAFHAGEHTTMWLIRTEDEAFYWEMVEGNESDQNEEPIAPQVYDAIYKQMSSWQQMTPKPADELPKDEWPGYFGFLSYHGSHGSKQMLLTLEDFVTCLDKTCLPGKLKSGRVMVALDPILIPESRKTYTHKSEAEIARMTPAQRIDEQISEHENHGLELSDKQSALITRYRRRDGLRGVEYVIQLIDAYQPKRTNDIRFHHAVMMATEIDEHVIRLRSSPDGRQAIDAIERLSVRMRSLGKKENYTETDLPSLKGVNMADDSVRDTLWVNYRIKMSDAELLEFSNYLVQLDPTYPSWSERDFIKDNSRINEAGSPAQVYVMKEPRRYYQAYLGYKKRTGAIMTHPASKP